MTASTSAALPRFVSFGEALTDMIRTGGNAWVSKEGGGPWNVARALSALGDSAAFGGAVSQDWFGDALWQASAAAGLDMRFMQRAARPPLLAMVYETNPPAYTFVGENSADLAYDPSLLPQGWEDGVAYAHFGGISLARPPLSGTLVALAARLKQRGVRICYDPNFRVVMTADYDPMLRAMCALADVIKVSDEDLRGLFRTDDAGVALDQLRELAPQAIVMLTEGERGAWLYAGQQSWHAVPPLVTIVDTVGAGDASVAGLLHALSGSGAPSEETLRFAVSCGTAACLNAGANPPAPAQVQGVLQQIS